MDPIFELKRTVNNLARVIQNERKAQAPVKTGALKRSIKVQGVFDGETIKFLTDYKGYGKFTDLGTGPYRVDFRNRGSWIKRPGKGRGGIKPRFWLTLKGTLRRNIPKTIAKILSDYIAKSFKKTST